MSSSFERRSGLVIVSEIDLQFGAVAFYLPPEALDFCRKLPYTTADYSTTPADLLEEIGYWHNIHGRFEEGTECLRRANDWREEQDGR